MHSWTPSSSTSQSSPLLLLLFTRLQTIYTYARLPLSITKTWSYCAEGLPYNKPETYAGVLQSTVSIAASFVPSLLDIAAHTQRGCVARRGARFLVEVCSLRVDGRWDGSCSCCCRPY